MKFKSLLVATLICLPFLSCRQDDIAALRKKAEQGDAQAQYNLCVFYAKGQGVPQDSAQAYAWINLSAEQGFMSAVEARSKIMKAMTLAQIQEGQRLSQEYAEKLIKK